MARKGDKTTKTNAMRELDRAGIAYDVRTYEVDDGVPQKDLGLRIAVLIGADPDSQFKTLVTTTPSGDHVVCCIPVAEELDLKKAAAAVEEKSLSMMHVRDLEPVCGYVRGACSPVGMKKRFRTLIDETAELYDTIGISGGRKGVTLVLDPSALVGFVGAKLADITA
ncbi:MAG: Cys-tRNA(Pro) deacylase [Atopobiaceae bacterium]|nr:Cys-tRNA(Pro) deacylase [Atopobiaceae bacterium]